MSENMGVVGLKKGAWSPEEDQKLFAQVTEFGTRNWIEIPKAAGLLRTGKSCRLRWLNYLQPGLKKGHFNPDEIRIIIQSHELYGNKWGKIASFLPGRTDNEIKNYYCTSIRGKTVSRNNIGVTTRYRSKKVTEEKHKRETISNPELSAIITKLRSAL